MLFALFLILGCLVFGGICAGWIWAMCATILGICWHLLLNLLRGVFYLSRGLIKLLWFLLYANIKVYKAVCVYITMQLWCALVQTAEWLKISYVALERKLRGV
jgi:hypothetical protein